MPFQLTSAQPLRCAACLFVAPALSPATQVTIELRKNKREEMVAKRRAKVDAENAPSNGGDATSGLASLSSAAEGAADLSAQIALIPQYMTQMQMQHDVRAQTEAVAAFRKLLSIEQNPPIDAVIAAGAVPFFVHFLQQETVPLLQFEAAWALTNIASGTSVHTKCVVDAGAIPIFAILLRSPVEDVREQAVWALGNIAGDSHVYRDALIAQNVLPRLAEMVVFEQKTTLVRNTTWTISVRAAEFVPARVSYSLCAF